MDKGRARGGRAQFWREVQRVRKRRPWAIGGKGEGCGEHNFRLFFAYSNEPILPCQLSIFLWHLHEDFGALRRQKGTAVPCPYSGRARVNQNRRHGCRRYWWWLLRISGAFWWGGVRARIWLGIRIGRRQIWIARSGRLWSRRHSDRLFRRWTWITRLLRARRTRR